MWFKHFVLNNCIHGTFKFQHNYYYHILHFFIFPNPLFLVNKTIFFSYKINGIRTSGIASESYFQNLQLKTLSVQRRPQNCEGITIIYIKLWCTCRSQNCEFIYFSSWFIKKNVLNLMKQWINGKVTEKSGIKKHWDNMKGNFIK